VGLRKIYSICIACLLLASPTWAQSVNANQWGIPGWLTPGIPPTPPAPGQPSVLFPVNLTLPLDLQANGISQAQINTWRYWNYRNRLRNEFRVYSVDQGGCLPAEMYIKIVNGSTKGNWGDSTIHLGWYIGVLATEFAMLTNRNYLGYGYPADLRNTVRELYCALGALERLDQFGEQAMWEDHEYYHSGITGTVGYQWPSTPGFFIRDDVASDTAAKLGYQLGVSDYTASKKTDKEMSQDQAAHLLMGLALVKHFVPVNVTYNGESLRGWAISKARDILSFMARSHTFPSDLNKVGLTVSERWHIEEPVTPKLNHFGMIPWFDPFHPVDPTKFDLVARGSEAFAFSYGFSLAGTWIMGNSFPVHDVYTQFWRSLPLYAGAAGTMNYMINQLTGTSVGLSDNLHMMMALAAIGDSWGHGTTITTLEALSVFENFHIYPLLNSVLHYGGGSMTTTEFKVPNMLAAAPYNGPASPPEYYNGWGSRNRFIAPRITHDDSGEGQFFRWSAHFNGLDYMLLNNLYYLANPNQFKRVQAPADRLDLPELPPITRQTAIQYKLPPIGYGYVSGAPRVDNACQANADVVIPIVIEYDDPNGNRDTVKIEVIHPSIGFITQTDAKNHFEFHGPFWDRWQWSDVARFRLWDEDGNSFLIEVPISYPGAIRSAPEVGHLFKRADVTVYGWGELFGYAVPLWGTLEWDFALFAVDWNCFPPKTAIWWVAGANNAVAWKVDEYSLHAVTGWTILDLHGTASVTVGAISEAGGPIHYYTIPINW
jgi:hypothetical protein